MAETNRRAPTVVKTTKDYLLVKFPMPKGINVAIGPGRKPERLSRAEAQLWKIIQEGERDLREGRTITAQSVKEALRRYAKRQWDR